MLGLSILFIIVALISGIIGFGFVAGTMAVIAKASFGIFALLTVIALVTGRRAIAA